MRADFACSQSDEPGRSVTWEQQLEGTPFARLLSVGARRASALEPASGPGTPGTRVTIELRQRLTRFLPALRWLHGAAARPTKTLDEALDGLERIGG